MKAYAYLRKSPDDSEDTQTSLNNQLKLINKVCLDNEFELIKTYVDKNVSGGDRLRKGFVEMISDAFEKKEVEVIVVKDQDRFARDSSFFSDTLKDLDLRGIKVFSCLKNNFISHEDLGDVVKSVVDEHQIIIQRKKTDVLFKQKMDEGLPPIKPPFGYKYNKKKMWSVRKKQAEIVREVFKDFKSKIPYKNTIKRLKIKTSLYYRIIKNIEKGVYHGWIIYTRKYRDSNKVVIRSEEIKYKGKHEPILSE